MSITCHLVFPAIWAKVRQGIFSIKRKTRVRRKNPSRRSFICHGRFLIEAANSDPNICTMAE